QQRRQGIVHGELGDALARLGGLGALRQERGLVVLLHLGELTLSNAAEATDREPGNEGEGHQDRTRNGAATGGRVFTQHVEYFLADVACGATRRRCRGPPRSVNRVTMCAVRADSSGDGDASADAAPSPGEGPGVGDA